MKKWLCVWKKDPSLGPPGYRAVEPPISRATPNEVVTALGFDLATEEAYSVRGQEKRGDTREIEYVAFRRVSDMGRGVLIRVEGAKGDKTHLILLDVLDKEDGEAWETLERYHHRYPVAYDPQEETRGPRSAASNSRERQPYRVVPVRPEELSVAVGAPPALQIPVYVDNLSIRGMDVLIDQKFDPLYSRGETLYLYITSPYLSEMLVVPSLVYRCAEAERGRLYDLKFVDWLGLLSRLPPSLAALFNLRYAPRSEPDSDSPIVVNVQGIETSFEISGFLVDISTAGLSFWTTPDADPQLIPADLVNVSFCLPDSSELLTFQTVIRDRRLVADAECYGAFFDEEGTEHFQQKQKKLAAHLDRKSQLSAQAEQ